MAEALKRPVWDEDITHGTPLSTALQELIAHYNQTGEYTPKTADQIQQQAAGEYKTYYDQQRLSAQQAYDRNRLALEQQLAGIGRSYDKAREASAREYGDAYSQADRALLGRGMQRSSYGMQTLVNLAQRGLEAQQDILDQQTQAEGNINAQQTQLAQQLADQLRQYDTSEQDATLARIRELEDQEYQRGVTNQNTRNQLSTQIYEYLRENNGSSGGSGGSSSSGGAGSPLTVNNNLTSGDNEDAAPTGNAYDAFMAALGGNGKTSPFLDLSSNKPYSTGRTGGASSTPVTNQLNTKSYRPMSTLQGGNADVIPNALKADATKTSLTSRNYPTNGQISSSILNRPLQDLLETELKNARYTKK